ncbi:MAG: hypothetical protein SFY81_07030 [Verrucomicrobiota bacterium]|nr:hypothetical protein [Verrucomicrobiota bacterium]
MKIKTNKKATGGYALLMVLVMSAVGLMALGGALDWTSTNARLTERNNEYFATVAAAEAATEKVLSSISRDYLNYGEGQVYNNLSTYRALVPTTAENPYWSGFSFSNGAGQSNQIHIERTTAWGYTTLQSQYSGLRGMASTYRIIANARSTNLRSPAAAGLRQEIQVASIPLFQFAIFYSMDLEINPGPNMNITGRVHSNADIYSHPQATLNYLDHVTAVGQIKLTKHPNDPLNRPFGSVNFYGERDGGVSSLTLPIGTNNAPQDVKKVIEIPPAGEDANSAMGRQRYYNKADLLVLVSNSTVTVKSGNFNSFATSVPWSDASKFVNTNVSFYNRREGKTIVTTGIDVGRLKTWSETNNLIRPLLGRDINSVYVADMRSQTGSTESGVRVANGQTLPSQGLTVATPNPLYVKGHYNAPAAHLGTTNTTLTKPASLVGDAITILSTAWNDANSTASLATRNASSTTVNAAFLAGIVPSGGGYYSGGVENFPRFLETWSGDTFTYNGSMVVMFYSSIATAPWGGSNVYDPPTRHWTFDLNFLDATKLPPGTPQVLATIRGSWAMIAPNSIL